ncbi:transposase [Lentzea tibetensis]|uniref:Transposase n=1 Tax=Lentzea tibetensis TaxID=2591470 RepID=A0A563EFF7_9PSEU|nr:transposase [Lentzea tibetensis]
MAMKHYPPEFKAEAVALYRSRPGATIRSVADDLGINSETLRNWIRLDDRQRTGSQTATPRPCRPRARRRTRTPRCASGSVSWRRNATSCARRQSISPGRRAGEGP